MIAARNIELPLIHDLEISLVQQARRIERRVSLPGTTLLAGNGAKLFVYERESRFERGPISSFCGAQERRELLRRGSVAVIRYGS
jgi:hypothetical protein